MANYCPYCASQIVSGTKCTFCNFRDTYSPKSHHLRPGTLLHGRYLIGVVLGEGGFGITYLGRDLALDMKVAVKEYYPSSMAVRSPETTCNVTLVSHSFLQDFQEGKRSAIKEAQALAKLDKEGAVVTVRDFFEENNSAYIVMEFVEGSDLRKEMRRTRKSMEPQNLLTLLEPVFSALGELHRQGLVHRDISPDNIMIENDVARLIDFGCAVPTRHDGQNANTVKHGFSPLEQYSNDNIGPWTDVYAMAATIYYCITGKVPPKSTDRAVTDTLQAPSALGIKFNPKQEKALMRAMSLDPKERFQSMEEFGKALFIHRKNKYKVIALAACLIALAAIVTALAVPRGTDVIVDSGRPKTVYTQADKIPEEESKKLDLLTKLLEENTSIECEDYYYYVVTKNTTGYEYENLYIYARLLSEDDTLIGSGTLLIEEWEKDRNFRDYVYSSQIPSEVQIKMSYDVEDDCYETGYVTIPYTVEEKHNITVVNPLPQELYYKDYSNKKSKFEITAIDIQTESYNTVNIYIDGEKTGGEKKDYEYLDYRLVSESGAVVETGNVYLPRLSTGERFENAAISFYDLAPGSYQFELCSKESS